MQQAGFVKVKNLFLSNFKLATLPNTTCSQKPQKSEVKTDQTISTSFPV